MSTLPPELQPQRQPASRKSAIQSCRVALDDLELPDERRGFWLLTMEDDHATSILGDASIADAHRLTLAAVYSLGVGAKTRGHSGLAEVCEAAFAILGGAPGGGHLGGVRRSEDPA